MNKRKYLLSTIRDDPAFFEMYVRISEDYVLPTDYSKFTGDSDGSPLLVTGKRPGQIPILYESFARAQNNLLELAEMFLQYSYKYMNSPTIHFFPYSNKCRPLHRDEIAFQVSKQHNPRPSVH